MEGFGLVSKKGRRIYKEGLFPSKWLQLIHRIPLYPPASAGGSCPHDCEGLIAIRQRSKSKSLPPHRTSTRSTYPLIWCEPPHPHEGSPSQDGRPMAQGGSLGHHLLLPHQHLSTPGRGLSTSAQYHHRRPTGRIYRTHCGYFPVPEPRFR